MMMRDQIDRNIESHPEMSILIAAGVGALLGSLVVATVMKKMQ